MSKRVNEWVQDAESRAGGIDMAMGREMERAITGTFEEVVSNDRALFSTILDHSGEELAEKLQTLGDVEQELER